MPATSTTDAFTTDEYTTIASLLGQFAETVRYGDGYADDASPYLLDKIAALSTKARRLAQAS